MPCLQSDRGQGPEDELGTPRFPSRLEKQHFQRVAEGPVDLDERLSEA